MRMAGNGAGVALPGPLEAVARSSHPQPGRSGIQRDRPMSSCDGSGKDYVIGVARTERPRVLSSDELQTARDDPVPDRKPCRTYNEPVNRTRKNWSQGRRVRAKAEQTPGTSTPSSVVTRLSWEERYARTVDEGLPALPEVAARSTAFSGSSSASSPHRTRTSGPPPPPTSSSPIYGLAPFIERSWRARRRRPSAPGSSSLLRWPSKDIQGCTSPCPRRFRWHTTSPTSDCRLGRGCLSRASWGLVRSATPVDLSNRFNAPPNEVRTGPLGRGRHSVLGHVGNSTQRTKTPPGAMLNGGCPTKWGWGGRR